MTIIGLEFASLIGNAFVVELVFAWPGMASYGVRSILQKDLNALMGVVMISGLVLRCRQSHRRRACRRRRSARPDPGNAGVSELRQRSRRALAPLAARFRRNPTAAVGSAIVALVVLAAILAPWISPLPGSCWRDGQFPGAPPAAVGALLARNRQCRPRHPDPRPVRLSHLADPGGDGADLRRASRRVLGLIAGYFGGWTETIIMRVNDIALAIPPLVMALAVTLC